MKKLKIAIIGQGRSGRDIHGSFLKTDQNIFFEVVAVVEKDAFRRENARKEYPGCQAYANYQELYARNDLDLVVNASYSEMHYTITKELLQHGFNVLVEKPFARNYYECCDLIRTAKEKGITLAVFQQTFLTPYYLHAQKTIKSGILGEILQINVTFSGFARRWDWQTLQKKMGGSAYNTGPHPIGLALGFLDFDDEAKVAFSKLNRALTSGDAEDYVKIILTAPKKPVVDVEISSTDAFSAYTLKIQGTRGTYQCTPQHYTMKYIVDEENPNRPVIMETLRNEKGFPMYCSEKLNEHKEEGDFDGTAFDTAVCSYYTMLYHTLTEGTPMAIKNENVAKIVNVIETVHAQNPLSVRF